MPIRNDHIDAVMAELSRFGIQGVLGERGKHLEVRWRYASGQERFIIVPKTPSDHRGALNCRSDTRRLLREDGVQPPTPQVVQFQKAMSLPRPDDLGAVRLKKLEEDFAGLLDWVGDLDAKLNEVLARLANAKVSMAVSFDLPQKAQAVAEEPVMAAEPVAVAPKIPGKNGKRKDALLGALKPGVWTSLGEIVCASGLQSKDVSQSLNYLKKTGHVENGLRGMWRKLPTQASQEAQSAQG